MGLSMNRFVILRDHCPMINSLNSATAWTLKPFSQNYGKNALAVAEFFDKRIKKSQAVAEFTKYIMGLCTVLRKLKNSENLLSPT